MWYASHCPSHAHSALDWQEGLLLDARGDAGSGMHWFQDLSPLSPGLDAVTAADYYDAVDDTSASPRLRTGASGLQSPAEILRFGDLSPHNAMLLLRAGRVGDGGGLMGAAAEEAAGPLASLGNSAASLQRLILNLRGQLHAMQTPMEERRKLVSVQVFKCSSVQVLFGCAGDGSSACA